MSISDCFLTLSCRRICHLASGFLLSCVSLWTASAQVSLSLLCVSSDRKFWRCFEHRCIRLSLLCVWSGTNVVVGTAHVSLNMRWHWLCIRVVSCRFLWVTCVSLLIASTYVSRSILCVSSDRRYSRLVDPDDVVPHGTMECRNHCFGVVQWKWMLQSLQCCEVFWHKRCCSTWDNGK